MCGRAVALVCILFLSASALVTRSPLPLPRARVCALKCVRVRSCRSRCSYSLCGHLGRPGSGYVLFCPRFHSSCLPFAFASSFPPTPYSPVLPPSVFLSLSTAVSFLYVLLLFNDIPYLSTNSTSILDLCAHEPPLQGASCMPEVLFWFALPAVWLLAFFQKVLMQQVKLRPFRVVFLFSIFRSVAGRRSKSKHLGNQWLLLYESVESLTPEMSNKRLQGLRQMRQKTRRSSTRARWVPSSG